MSATVASFVVVASKGGGPRNPDWVANAQANPQCWIHVARKQIPVIADVAQGAERAELFAIVCRQKPNVARYQERAATYGREIPLLVLRPNAESL